MRSFILAMISMTAADVALAQRNTQGCRQATNLYNSVVQNVAAQLQTYTTCVTTSRGTRDCGGAFSRLKTAQGDFEDAVNAMRQECR